MKDWLNSILSYSAVDEILQLIAERIGEALNSGDVVGATGRYQIGCLLVDLLTDNHAILAANKILKILTQTFTRNNRRIILTSCIGIASNTHNGSDLGQIMSNASFALHQVRFNRESIKLFAEEEEELVLLGSIFGWTWARYWNQRATHGLSTAIQH